MSMGDRIKQRRTALKLSQATVGKAVGRGQNAVSNWERGETGTAVKVVNELATILKCDRDWLLYGDAPKPLDGRVPVMGIRS